MLTNKVAMVTEAAQGIGYGVSVAFAKAGADVVLTDYQPQVVEVAEKLNAEVESTVVGIVMDITKDDAIDNALSQVMSKFNRLDYAINNAGGGVLKPFAELTNEDFDHTVGLDLIGTFKCMRAELQLFLKQGFGSIVNTGALGSFYAPGGFGAYNAAKNGIMGMTQAAAVDYADANIRVNCVAPGLTKTPLNDGAFIETMTPTVPMKRYETVDELAKVFVFIASEATFMTGQTVLVDGGVAAGMKQEAPHA